jgi:ABC-type uncharacterized transport system substrate-binding protein
VKNGTALPYREAILRFGTVHWFVGGFSEISCLAGISRSSLGDTKDHYHVMRKRTAKNAILLFSFVLTIFPVLLYAHPHVFMDTTVTAHFNEEGISGFFIEWMFDEMFSSMIINDFDENYDSYFDTEESKKIEQGAFSNLKNFHYFTYIWVNGNEIQFKKVTQFLASINGNNLTYRFFIPCAITIGDGEAVVTVGAYDESYYCDVGFAKKTPFMLKNGEGYDVRHEIVQDLKNPIYYGQVFPFVLKLHVRRSR